MNKIYKNTGPNFQLAADLKADPVNSQSAEVENTQLKAEVVRYFPSEEEGSESYIVAAKFANVNDRFLMAILAMVTDLIKKKSRRDT